MNNKLLSYIGWLLVAVLGAFALGAVALNRGETVSSVWLVTAALCIYFIGYRFYSKFIAERVLQLDDNRMTPAVARNDGPRLRPDQ
jgi:carbon starvation protein